MTRQEEMDKAMAALEAEFPAASSGYEGMNAEQVYAALLQKAKEV